MLLDFERFPTSYALAMLAQEEYAKAFLLCLVDAGAVHWSADVRRALKDHVCKQLLSVILDYLWPDTDEFLRRLNSPDTEPQIFPAHVLDAIHLICHERLPEQRRSWREPSEPLDPKVKAIAEGKMDRQKQDAIYVGLGKTGQLCSRPTQITKEWAQAQLEVSQRISSELRPYGRPPGLPDDLNSEKLITIFQLLTGRLSVEEFNTHWWARR